MKSKESKQGAELIIWLYNVNTQPLSGRVLLLGLFSSRADTQSSFLKAQFAAEWVVAAFLTTSIHTACRLLLFGFPP